MTSILLSIFLIIYVFAVRYSVLLSSSLIALGTSVRCLFLVVPELSESDFTLLCHLGALLNGVPSIVVTSAPPAVSAAWFPPSERVTATSISQMMNNLGTGLSFLLANIIVKDPSDDKVESSTAFISDIFKDTAGIVIAIFNLTSKAN